MVSTRARRSGAQRLVLSQVEHPRQVPLDASGTLPVVLGAPWDFSKLPQLVFVDLFCGLGGTTTGAVRAFEALGFKVGETARVIAVNHDEDAILSHAANHPEAEHINCDIEKLEPRLVLTGHVCKKCHDLVATTPCPARCVCGAGVKVHQGAARACPSREGSFEGIKGERITVLARSAPCQPWSPAANAPYTKPQSRATPDYSRKWVKVGAPLVIVEENVWEIKSKWSGWPAHVASIEADGYRTEVDRLNAADFGVPQERKRLILLATRGRRPIHWPVPTHCNPRRPVAGRKPWVGADTCIDRSIPCPSFFGGKKDGRGRPTGRAYSPRVRARLARYIREKGRFWEPLAKAVEEFSGKVPLADALAACPPEEWPSWIVRQEDGNLVLVAEEGIIGQHGGNVPSDASEPSPAVTTDAYIRLAQLRCVLPPRGRKGGEMANAAYDPAGRPSHAVVAGKQHGHYAEVRLTGPSCILPRRTQRGGRDGEEAYDPADHPSHAVVASHTLGHFAETRIVGQDLILGGGGSGTPARDLGTAAPAMTSGGAWVGAARVEIHPEGEEACILPHHGEAPGQKPRIHPASGPAPTVPASRRLEVAFAFIVSYGRTMGARALDRVGATITTHVRHFLAVVRASALFLDLGYRQVTPREAARIQGFAPDVKLVGTIEAQQRGVGNAVPPPLAEAILLAVLKMLGRKRPRKTSPRRLGDFELTDFPEGSA